MSWTKKLFVGIEGGEEKRKQDLREFAEKGHGT
jgi:hypothetical protein